MDRLWTRPQSITDHSPSEALRPEFLEPLAKRIGYFPDDFVDPVPRAGAEASLRAIGDLQAVKDSPTLAKKLVAANPALYLYLPDSVRANADVALAAFQGATVNFLWPTSDIVAKIPPATLPEVFARLDPVRTDVTYLPAGFFEDGAKLAQQVARNPASLVVGSETARNSAPVVAALTQWVAGANRYQLAQKAGDVALYPQAVLAKPELAARLVETDASRLANLPAAAQPGAAAAFESALRAGESKLKVWAVPNLALPATTAAKLTGPHPDLALGKQLAALGGYPLLPADSSLRQNPEVALAFVLSHPTPDHSMPRAERNAHLPSMSYLDRALDDVDSIGDAAVSADPSNLFWLSPRLQRKSFEKALDLDGQVLTRADPQQPGQVQALAAALGARVRLTADGKLQLTRVRDAVTAASQSGEAVLGSVIPEVVKNPRVAAAAVREATQLPVYQETVDGPPGADVLAAVEAAPNAAKLRVLAGQVTDAQTLAQLDPDWSTHAPFIEQMAREGVPPAILFGGASPSLLDEPAARPVLLRALEAAGPAGWEALPDSAFKRDDASKRAALLGWNPDPTPWLSDPMQARPLASQPDPALLDYLHANDAVAREVLERAPRSFRALSAAQRGTDALIHLALPVDADLVNALPAAVLNDLPRLAALITDDNPLALAQLPPARRELLENADPRPAQAYAALHARVKAQGWETHPERFHGSAKLLRELLDNQERPLANDPRPVAVVTVANYDPVHAGAALELEDLVQHGYRVMYFNVSKVQNPAHPREGLEDALALVGQQKKAELWLNAAHGYPSGFDESNAQSHPHSVYDVTVDDSEALREADLGRWLAPNAPVIAMSCMGAKGKQYQRNIVNVLSQAIPGSPVYGTTLSTDLSLRLFGPRGRLLDPFFGPAGMTYVARNGRPVASLR